MVGTQKLWVTRWRSSASTAASALNRSITTTVAPSRWAVMAKRSGPAWYSGADDR